MEGCPSAVSSSTEWLSQVTNLVSLLDDREGLVGGRGKMLPLLTFLLNHLLTHHELSQVNSMHVQFQLKSIIFEFFIIYPSYV